MDELQELAGGIAARFKARSVRHFAASIIVKIVLIIGGSALAGLAQFTQFPEGSSPTAWQVVGMAATGLVALGGIFMAITESDASKELEMARAAVEQAQTYASAFDEFERYENDLLRSTELYAAINAMREVVEQTIGEGGKDEIAAIKTIMETAGRSLAVACGFEQADRWTICVYKAQLDATSHGMELVCAAHRRAIECDLTEARKWPEGVGTAGMAYSNGREIIVPDMSASELGTVFDLGIRKKGYDSDRYKSIATIPIRTSRDGKPWGVVVATNDRANHFYVDHKPGIQPAEAARALAAMIGLAVVVCRPPMDTDKA